MAEVAEGAERGGNAASEGGYGCEEVAAGKAALVVSGGGGRVDDSEAARVPASGAVERVRDAARLLRFRHSAAMDE